MKVCIACLSCALLVGLGLALPRVAVGADDQEGALASYLDQPHLYVELFDLSALERDVRQSGIGRLASRFLPALEGHLEGDEVIERLGLDPVSLGRGELSIEDALATGLARLARDELGMSERDAVRVAASLGSRVSIAYDATGNECGDGSWAVSWSLRAGGADVVVDTLAPHVQAMAGEDAPELLVMRREGDGTHAAWSIEDDRELYVVVRPDLLALTSSESTLERLLERGSQPQGSGRVAVGSELELARAEAMRRDDSLWMWIDGALMERAAAREGKTALEVARVLGLDRIQSFQVSLSAANGQLASRLRIDKSGNDGLLGLLRGRQSEWRGLDQLTSDAFGVAGLCRSPSGLIHDLDALLERIDDTGDFDVAFATAQNTPLVRELLAPGALGDEVVLFARPGAAGIPMVYLAMPATPQLLEDLGRLRGGQTAFGGELSLRTKELEGHTCWMLTEGGGHGLAVTTQDDTLIASYSLLALQDYMRQRSRERVEDRAQLIASLRSDLASSQRATGHSPHELAGFAHVRMEPLAEFVWPWMMMGLTMSGVEGLEDLPDAIEIAEEIGDTTLILFELDDAIELRGRGLFGGLGVLF